MKKLIKIVVGFVVFIIVGIAAALLYLDRSQQIDFTAYFPNELDHCGKTIYQNDAEYIDLLNWFNANKDGWRYTPASYVPGNIYASPAFSANILGDRVIVNYQAKNGAWNQVHKEKKPEELSYGCSKANKAN